MKARRRGANENVENTKVLLEFFSKMVFARLAEDDHVTSVTIGRIFALCAYDAV